MFCGSAPLEDCIEPDFTEKGSREWDRKLTPTERQEVLFVPAKFRYLQTAQKDPRVDPEWPLASFWPAYLSNFMVYDWFEQHWYGLVSDFFAYHGFQTRMIYFHLLDTEYIRVQKKNFLIEALVYFGSEEECERAIATCHRKQYFGHRVNVLSGRAPEYFCNDRSVRFVKKTCQQSESFLELSLIPFGKVELAIRHSVGNILVQFTSKKEMLKALPGQIYWKPIQLVGQVRMQRFLEAEVKMGIKWVIESQEARFLERRPRPRILQYFEDGIHPIVDNSWSKVSIPKLSKPMLHEKKAGKLKLRQVKKRDGIKSRFVKYMKSAEYQKMSESKKKELCEEVFRKYGFDPMAPKKPKSGQTRKQKQASVLASVNYFMRQNGRPVLKKADQDEMKSERVKVVQMIKDAVSQMD